MIHHESCKASTDPGNMLNRRNRGRLPTSQRSLADWVDGGEYRLRVNALCVRPCRVPNLSVQIDRPLRRTEDIRQFTHWKTAPMQSRWRVYQAVTNICIEKRVPCHLDISVCNL